MTHVSRLTLLLLLLLGGCQSGPDSSYGKWSDEDLLWHIRTDYLTPTAYDKYARRKAELDSKGVNYLDAARFSAGCVSDYLARHASRQELEIIWDIQAGTEKKVILDQRGQFAYLDAVHVEADGQFDCISATNNWIARQQQAL